MDNLFEAQNNRLIEAVLQNDPDEAKSALFTGANPNLMHRGLRPLHIAAARGFSEVAEILIENGADVNAQDATGSLPLKDAVFSRSFRVVELMINEGSLIDQADHNGVRPLHIAAIRGCPDIASLLLERGADINAKTNRGNTPIHLAAEQGGAEVTKVLLQKQIAKHNEFDAFQPCNPHSAEFQQVAKVLIDQGADLEIRDANGMTPLMAAVKHGDAEIIKTLLQAGANKEAENSEGYTPLMLGILYGKMASVHTLLVNGADVSKAAKNESFIDNAECYPAKSPQRECLNLLKSIVKAKAEYDIKIQEQKDIKPAAAAATNRHATPAIKTTGNSLAI